jgi:Uma2 family endonuclease
MADFTQTRMTVAEFLELPESNQIIELIHGKLVVTMPLDQHQVGVGNAYSLARQLATSGTVRVASTGVYLDEFNFLLPSVFWVNEANPQCSLSSDGYWHGAPDLVIMVLTRYTPHGILGIKIRLYEQYRARELWLVVPDGTFIEVFIRHDDQLIHEGLYYSGNTFASQVLSQSVEVKALFESA